MRFLLSIFFTCLALHHLHAQDNTLYQRTIPVGKKVLLDSFTVYEPSIKVNCNGEALNSESFSFSQLDNSIIVLSSCGDSVVIYYRTFRMQLHQELKLRDTSIIYSAAKGDINRYKTKGITTYDDIFGTSAIQKKGSISRGIAFGNNQDLSINSSLNLELIGDLAPNLKILASVTDDNLPIQPQGNTNKLQEFDQVFIQIYNDQFKLIAGDFWLSRPSGYFLNYKKRAQGINGEYSWNPSKDKKWKIQGSAALSKGKFARQIIQGVEGNQGPYRLRGNENEPFIVILSGTERVYIDGKLLERGQEFDYTIDYNTAEVIFTAKNFITKDIRIVVEFQYSDLNYARSLVQTSLDYSSKKMDFWLHTYSEQDAKNQTIQQDLSTADKLLLSDIGDSLLLARTNSIDSIGFTENQNMYKLIDSLGIDSVLVFSINPDSALYRASFTFVEDFKGNYILDESNALGKIFRWVAPVGGIPQGNYEPAKILFTPKQKQFLSSGFKYRFSPKFSIEAESAYSVNDINSYSSKDSKDDAGFSQHVKSIYEVPFAKKDSVFQWKFRQKTELEYLSTHFSPIEQYRAVEFDRDWNTRTKNYQGQQLLSALSAEFEHIKKGNLGLEFSYYSIGTDFNGIKSRLYGKWNTKKWSANWNAALLKSSSTEDNQFLRHKVQLSRKFKRTKLSYKDDFERNTFQLSSTLKTNSYLFYDKEFSYANVDSSKFNYKLFYRERLDMRSDSTRLSKAAKARTAGVDLLLTRSKNQKINLILNYRELSIADSNLISDKPENTLLGRIDYDQKLWNSALTWNTFYEVGSGLELKRDFIYVQVNDGQGVYTWIDYDEDGIKDLNEFEIAQFVDQASYIRVFTPSNEYVKTYSTEFNQSFFFKPEKLWATKKGFLKFMSRFSNQGRLRIQRKTMDFDVQQVLNPFQGDIRDSALISSSSTIRNNLFFNRLSAVFAADYTFQLNQSKTLLATGFDARLNQSNELNFRLNVKKKFSLEGSLQQGQKIAQADYTTGRNFDIRYSLIKPTFIFQPNTTFRFALNYRYQEKKNVAGEQAFINEYGMQLKYNQLKKGSFQAQFSYISILYQGETNSALVFEML
ncbi:MAG: hypothetical protein ACK5B9_01360 [Flavobacteriia bacterium]